MDLTDFSGVQNTPQIPQVSIPNSPASQENLRVPDNEAAREFRKSHWTIDKAAEDGQIIAGEVDQSQVEFLKNTEMVSDEKEKGVSQ